MKRKTRQTGGERSARVVPEAPLRILPLGGLGEIGMNCLVLESPREIVVIDCGLIFSDLEHLGVEFGVPDFSYLVARKEKIAAFVFTHGHEDHIGALTFALRAGLSAPCYASRFTSLLLRERLAEAGLADRTELRVFEMGKGFSFRDFSVTPVSVNHSIIDSAALFIDTPWGKIVHTGDFKIDPAPFYGSTLDPMPFQRAGGEGVALLLSDSTNVERMDPSLSEIQIFGQFERLFASARGLVVVSMFSSNVARMGQVFRLAARMGKRIALAGRSMETNARLACELGYLQEAASTLIAIEDIERFPRDRVIVLSTGSQAETRSSLTRIARGEHGRVEIGPGDLVVLSSKMIPGNEKAIGRMINDLFRKGAEVVYESMHAIHSSGHATKPELRRMLEWTRPRWFIPIHGEFRHLVHHAALARETGMPPERVIVATNGDVLELSGEGLRVVDRIEESRVLVEGREGGDISKLVLKERRQLGETGVVFSIVIKNSADGSIVSGPDVIAKGLVHESREQWLLEDAKEKVRATLARFDTDQSRGAPAWDLQEEIRVVLRRFFRANTGKKPVVLPIVLEI